MFVKNVCVLIVVTTHGLPTLKTSPCHVQLFTVHVVGSITDLPAWYDCFFLFLVHALDSLPFLFHMIRANDTLSVSIA